MQMRGVVLCKNIAPNRRARNTISTEDRMGKYSKRGKFLYKRGKFYWGYITLRSILPCYNWFFLFLNFISYLDFGNRILTMSQ